MKKIIFLLIIILSFSAKSQFNTTKWYFGHKAGLDFSSGTPTLLNDGKTTGNEGVATVCDEYGNLLFYSDGKSVWNKKHELMNNGSELSGNQSATNAAYAVPHPHNDNLFYLFTCDEAENKLARGLTYSIIDVSANQGLGEIIEKNITLNSPNSEKIIAVPRSNQPAYWIITHDWNKSDFLVYNLDPYGIELIHRISSEIYEDSNFTDFGLAAGYIRYNRNSEALAVAAYGKGFYIFDFDVQSGMLTPQHSIEDTLAQGTYGLEFSPNGQFLYTTTFDTLNSNAYLIQYEIDELNSTCKDFTGEVIHVFSLQSGAIQKGPDDKIYISTDKQAISVIEAPDKKGFECLYKDKAIKFSGDHKVLWGFPPEIPLLQTPKYRILSNAPVCENDSLVIEANIISGCKYYWTGPNGFTADSRLISFKHAAETDFGTYVCNFIIDGDTTYSDTITVEMIREALEIDKNDLDLGVICRGYYLQRQVEIVNSAVNAIVINSIDINQKMNYDLNTDLLEFPITLSSGDTLEFMLNFMSNTAGFYPNELYLNYEFECDSGIKTFAINAQVLDANLDIKKSNLIFDAICYHNSAILNIPVHNDSENDIEISEMYFKNNSGFEIIDTIRYINSGEEIDTRIFFANRTPGIYTDTLMLIYDLTCERGIRQFEFTIEVTPFEMDIALPDLQIFQGADTCFYMTYETNCDLPDDFFLEFELEYNPYIFIIDYTQNASIPDSTFTGDMLSKEFIIENFNHANMSDTLCKVCGHALLTSKSLTDLNINNVITNKHNVINSDPGRIKIQEICFQDAMQIAMYINAKMEIFTVENTAKIELEIEEKGNFELSVINYLSNTVYHEVWHNSKKTNKSVIIPDLPSGLYFAILHTSGDHKIRKKFIIVN